MNNANAAPAADLSSLRISRAVEAGRAAAAVDFINGRNDASTAFGAQEKVATAEGPWGFSLWAKVSREGAEKCALNHVNNEHVKEIDRG